MATVTPNAVPADGAVFPGWYGLRQGDTGAPLAVQTMPAEQATPEITTAQGIKFDSPPVLQPVNALTPNYAIKSRARAGSATLQAYGQASQGGTPYALPSPVKPAFISIVVVDATPDYVGDCWLQPL